METIKVKVEEKEEEVFVIKEEEKRPKQNLEDTTKLYLSDMNKKEDKHE